MSTVERVLVDNPELVAIVIAIARAVLAWQRGLTWYEYRALAALQRRIFPALDPIARRYGRPLTREKPSPYKTSEYVETIHRPPFAVAKTIRDVFSPHLLATAKYRAIDGTRQYATYQLVQVHNGLQTHVYLFPAAGGEATDVYAHVEASVTNPVDHQYGKQRPGDNLGAFASAYHDAD